VITPVEASDAILAWCGEAGEAKHIGKTQTWAAPFESSGCVALEAARSHVTVAKQVGAF